MISQLKGTVVTITENTAVIDVCGVGFAVLASTATLSALHCGEETTLNTTLIVRDDALTLYGFATVSERQIFEQLLSVSGVGPKVALSMLSSFTADELMLAIAQGDAELIATAQGIGKKTAQRVIVELKGAFEQALAATKDASGKTTGSSEATEALLGMGFTAQEAQLALKGYDGKQDDSNALLRYALRRLGS